MAITQSIPQDAPSAAYYSPAELDVRTPPYYRLTCIHQGHWIGIQSDSFFGSCSQAYPSHLGTQVWTREFSSYLHVFPLKHLRARAAVRIAYPFGRAWMEYPTPLSFTTNSRSITTRDSRSARSSHSQQVMTDHMIAAHYDPVNGWSAPQIKPYGPFSIDPASSCLQYATNVFEGMKVRAFTLSNADCANLPDAAGRRTLVRMGGPVCSDRT